MSRSLSSSKLDELFYDFKLYKQSNNSFKKNGIALLVDSNAKINTRANKKKKKKETPLDFEGEFESESDISSSKVANLVRKIMIKGRRFIKRQTKNFSDQGQCSKLR